MTRWNSSSKYHKYHASKVVYEGQTFDSRKELKRYKELILLQQAGEIKNLQRQVKYTLIPEQRENDLRGPRGGIIKGKLVERSVSYIADFVYEDARTGETVVEDVKGIRTKEYIIKRKLMLYVHGIKILET